MHGREPRAKRGHRLKVDIISCRVLWAQPPERRGGRVTSGQTKVADPSTKIEGYIGQDICA